MAGAQAEYTLPLLVNAPPDAWIGVVAIFGTDGAERGEGVHYVSDWLELSKARRATLQ